jgi:hypothetical protein
VGGGWTLAWLVALALASSSLGDNLITGLVLILIGWATSASLVAGALRWALPGTSPKRSLMIAIGWPVCILLGLAVPIGLQLGYEGAVVLWLAIAVAGFLAAVAFVPSRQQVPWHRALLVAAAWSAGWLWPGTTAWPAAFWRLTNGYSSTWPDLFGYVPMLLLASGGLLSGLAGGLVLHLLLRPSTVRKNARSS